MSLKKDERKERCLDRARTLAFLLTTRRAVCDSVFWGWGFAGFVKASTYSGNRNATPSKHKSCRDTKNGICCLFSCRGAEEETQNPQPLLLSQILAPYWGILGPAEAATAEPSRVPQRVSEDQKGPRVLAMAFLVCNKSLLFRLRLGRAAALHRLLTEKPHALTDVSAPCCIWFICEF